MLDQVKIYVSGGKGGDGIVAFRREKYIPNGGPAGGDGGHGGDVILKVNPRLNTLAYFERQVHFRAKPGERGGGSRKTGASASPLEIEVPPGTVVRDAETDTVIADLVRPDDQVVAARGGRGGRGNCHFATASNQAPRIAEKGEPPEERWLTLELRLIADVGIVGVPNAGKSTLLSVISNAKPKIASYAFTTLEPNLGVVLHDHRDLVFADIPGLVEGAHMGVGLGHSFLRHVQRTRVLIHLLNGENDDPLADFNQINMELALFDDRLRERPQIVVLNKMDLPDVQAKWPHIEAELRARGIEPLAISAATQQHIDILVGRAFQVVDETPDEIVTEAVEMPLYELPEDELAFEITEEADGYRVSGKRIERAAAMTYWDYDQAVQRFARLLTNVGITAALRERGVQPGDTVYIGKHVLEWSEEE